MSDRRVVIDRFAEDKGHEELIGPLVTRVACEVGMPVRVRTLSARGGRGKAVREFELYQQQRLKRPPLEPAELVIVAIDANCATHTEAVGEVMAAVTPEFERLSIAACPDPHIERWYLADLQASYQVVGVIPSVPRDKCERGFYKRLLARAVVEAGHPPTLGGIEFARELAQAMDFYRAGRSERSLKHFIDELRSRLLALRGAEGTEPSGGQ